MILFYLLFNKNVEGMESAVRKKNDNDSFFSFFSNFLSGLMNIFFEEENDKWNIKEDENYNITMKGLDFDLGELITTVYSNISNEDPYSEGCSISRKHLIDYGFSKLIVDYTFKEIFNDTQELDFVRFDKFIRLLLSSFNQKRYQGVEGIDNQIDIDKLENKMRGNPKDLIMSGLALLFCLLANGNSTIKKDKINENLRVLSSVNEYSKNISGIITRVRSSLLKD